MVAQARITSKGQVTIPKSVREALDLNEGDGLLFRVEDSTAVISKEPGLLDLAGSVPVPADKRGLAWEDIRVEARQARGRRYER
jgi:antitoxin PrlF